MDAKFITIIEDDRSTPRLLTRAWRGSLGKIPVYMHNRKLKKRGIELRSINNLGSMEFFPGKMIDTLFAAHPYALDSWFQADNFDHLALQHRACEAVRFLGYLGARYIRIESKTSMSDSQVEEVHLAAKQSGSADLRREIDHRKSGSINLEFHLPGHGHPTIPNDLTWFKAELTWQTLAEQRCINGVIKASLEIKMEEGLEVSAKVLNTAAAYGIEAASFEAYKKNKKDLNNVFTIHAEFPGLVQSTGSAGLARDPDSASASIQFVRRVVGKLLASLRSFWQKITA